MSIDPSTLLTIYGVAQGASAIASGVQASNYSEAVTNTIPLAEKAIADAKRQASINTQMGRSLPMEVYDQQTENLMQQYSTVLKNVGGQDQRSAFALAPILAQKYSKDQQGIEMQRRKDYQALEKDIADEQSSINTALSDISLKEAEGYQKQIADLRQQQKQSTENAMGSITDFADMYGQFEELGLLS